MSTTLKINQLKRDGGTQSRAELDQALVEEYRQLVEDRDQEKPEGVEYMYPFKDPVKVIHDGSHHWLYDGFHRTEALVAYYGDEAEIVADVYQGSQQYAQWLSFGANRDHGLRRSNFDKRRAVIGALKHNFGNESYGYHRSDRELARHTGVDAKTVGNIRHELEAAGEIPQSAARIGADGREIQTDNIGRPSNGATDQQLPMLADSEWRVPQDWLESIVRPWQQQHEGEIPAVKRGDGYLVIEPQEELIRRFDLSVMRIYPQGSYQGSPIDVLYMDEKVLEHCMREFPLFVVHELHGSIKLFVAAISRSFRIPRNEFKLRDFEVQLGGFVREAQSDSIRRVDELDEICIRTKSDGRFYAISNRRISSVDALNHTKNTAKAIWASLPGATWRDRWQAAKQVFAREAILVCRIRNEFLVSFGDDAKAFAGAVKDQAAWIAPDVALKRSDPYHEEQSFKKGMGVFIYRDSDADLVAHLSHLMRANCDTDLETVSSANEVIRLFKPLMRTIAGVKDETLRAALVSNLTMQADILRNSAAGAFVTIDDEVFQIQPDDVGDGEYDGEDDPDEDYEDDGDDDDDDDDE